MFITKDRVKRISKLTYIEVKKGIDKFRGFPLPSMYALTLNGRIKESINRGVANPHQKVLIMANVIGLASEYGIHNHSSMIVLLGEDKPELFKRVSYTQLMEMGLQLKKRPQCGVKMQKNGNTILIIEKMPPFLNFVKEMILRETFKLKVSAP